MSAPLVEAREVLFRRGAGPGAFALEVPRFTLAAGETVACVGPSGAGKSTFLQLLCGILTPERGSVRVAGTELAGLSGAARRRLRLERVGLVFQELELLEHLSVRDNVLLPWTLGRRTGDRPGDGPGDRTAGGLAERERELSQAVAALGIEALVARRPRALSQGERQRVAIARGLLGRPALVLADEPTGNLDPASAARAVDHLLERAAACGSGVVFVTHQEELLPRFERVVAVRARGGTACVS